MLIDTGLDLDICEKTLRLALKSLNVNMNKLDICLTHFHNDHAALINRLKTDNMTIWCGKFDWYNLADEVTVIPFLVCIKESMK